LVIDCEVTFHANGDQYFCMSADIQFPISLLPPGDPNAAPYTYIPPWPLDPNAPVIDKDDDEWDWEE
jgi:hypothetical protein